MKLVKIDSIVPGAYLTVAETAEMTGIKEQGIRQKLYEGTWVTFKFGHMTLLSVAEVARHLKNKGGVAKG